MVDSARTEEAKEELQDENLKNVALLVFADKKDLTFALSTQEIAEKLMLDGVKDRKLSIFACSAITKEGIQEGMEWLVANMRKDK